jgi:hypothetical protein
LLQVALGFEVGRFIGSFQADEFGQSRGVAHFQPQRGIGRVMPLVFAFMVVIVPAQLESAKNPLPLDRFPTLANLSGFGLVSCIDALGGLLEQPAD